jgi:hypothetical protein
MKQLACLDIGGIQHQSPKFEEVEHRVHRAQRMLLKDLSDSQPVTEHHVVHQGPVTVLINLTDALASQYGPCRAIFTRP